MVFREVFLPEKIFQKKEGKVLTDIIPRITMYIVKGGIPWMLS